MMTRLLNIEWMKVKNYRTFWILIALFTVGAPLLVLAFEGINARLPISTAFNFPNVYETTAWLTSFMTPVMGILLIILLTNENNFRTLRQNIIDGSSREQYIAAKFGVMLSLVIFITILIAITGLVFGLKHGGIMYDGGFKLIVWSALQSMAYLSFAFFLGTFMKRSGIAIAIYVFYAYIGEFMISGLLDFKVKFHSGAFLPFEATDRLLAGESKMIRNLMKQSPPPSDTTYILIALFYIILFCTLSWYRMKKSDL